MMEFDVLTKREEPASDKGFSPRSSPKASFKDWWLKEQNS